MNLKAGTDLALPYGGVTAVAAAFLAIAIIFGGGGADAPVFNGFIEALAGLLFVAAAAAHFAGRPLPPQAAGPLWFIAAILLLIGMQLVPLPATVWRALPGRETASAVADLIGQANAWRPLSLDPEATRRHAAALLVPAAILTAGLAASHRGLILLARVLVGAALLSALIGAVQISLGSPAGLAFHDAPAKGVATGVFANPNHHADLMLAGLIATALLIRLEPPQVRIRRPRGDIIFHLGWLLVPIFMAMTVGTQSRAGIALLIPAAAAAMIIAVKRKGAGRLLVILLAVIAAAVAVYAVTPGSLERLMKLQSLLLEGRVVFIPDVLFTLNQYWPWGSGLGTFVPVFQANENLDLLQPLRVNHAHNDLLELLIEAGAAGALLMAAVLIGLCWRLLGLIRRRASVDPGPALAGFTIIALLLLHSLVDYPLRTRSLAAVAAVALVFLFSPAQQRPASDPAASKRKPTRKGFGRPGPALPGRRARRSDAL